MLILGTSPSFSLLKPLFRAVMYQKTPEIWYITRWRLEKPVLSMLFLLQDDLCEAVEGLHLYGLCRRVRCRGS